MSSVFWKIPKNIFEIIMSTVEKILNLVAQSGETNSCIEKKLGLSNASFHAWKNGKAKPSTDAIIKIARYFNVTSDYLLGLSDKPTS